MQVDWMCSVCVWAEVFAETKSATSHPDAYGRSTFQMQRVRQTLQRAEYARAAHAYTYARTTVRLRSSGLWQSIQRSRIVDDSQANPYR